MFGPNGYHQTIACIRKQGTLYNTYTTAKSLLTSATSVVGVSDQLPIIAPPNYYAGHKWVIDFTAAVSNIATTPGTMNFQVVLGGIVVYDSGALILTTTAHTLLPVIGQIHLTLDTSGNGTLAKCRGRGVFSGQMLQQTGAALADAATASQTVIAPATTLVLSNGFNSAQANALDFFAGFSISNAGNGVQLWDYEVTDRN